MNKLLLVLPILAVGVVSLEACGPTNTGCATNDDCLPGEACQSGTCVAASTGECTDGAQRACGHEAIGVCKPGTQTCVGGAWETACAGEVKPGVETCNRLDDDCDGEVDNGLPKTGWYSDIDGDGHGDAMQAATMACSAPAGLVSSHDDCNDRSSGVAPGLPEVCGNSTDDNCDGTIDEGCGCPSPGATSACCSGRGTQTCGTDGVLSACSVTASAETCNGVDDDCDGVADNGANLCGGGQACVAGSCACTGGQSLCNGTCVTVSAEVCDGVDNDCDGSIDEGRTIACYADADGDLYADSAVVSQQCAVSAACPAGYVATTSSLGDDCNPGDAARYRLVSSYADADNDGHCVGAASNDCVGATPLPGRRFAASCESTADCADDNAQAWLFDQVRSDADGDGYCVGTAASTCVGPSWVPAGTRRATQCQATDDCNDASAAQYVMNAFAPDADNDGYCTVPPPSSCGGSTPPAGYRVPSTCTAFTDCAPADASRYRTVSVRADGDNDGWCSGLASSVCVGAGLPAGQILATSCGGEDCSDTNGYVTSTCFISQGYSMSSHTQTCPSANTPTLYSVTVLNTCPPGFNTVNYRAVRAAGTGSCTYGSPSQVYQQCNFLDGSTCGVVADCQAL